jgi:hypothetical protein
MNGFFVSYLFVPTERGQLGFRKFNAENFGNFIVTDHRDIFDLYI